MKAQRQKTLLEIITNEVVETQEELINALLARGFSVTQATVSRDINELKIVKRPVGEGKYRYAVNSDNGVVLETKFKSIFRESVIGVDYAGNTVVIKCFTGMANAACAALDTMNFEGMVGSLAGDDTIFILMKDEDHCARFKESVEKLYK